VGSVIGGKYRLRRRVGEGAMASVWSAVHETLGRPVAVKLIHDRGMNSELATARFMQEARIAAAVQHRFVVDIFDFGKTEQGEPYMVMELLQGEALADRISRGPPMPVRSFVRILAQCLSGLEAVHRAGIVHRDLKPENIFIIHDAEGGFPKLLDFGISRVEESFGGQRVNRLTKEGTLLGTPWFMSPEQVRGNRDVDHRTDIYSIGVIAYEALSGRLPFDAEAMGELLISIATDEPTPLSEIRPDLPVELCDVIGRALAKNPADRFPTARAMRAALRAVDRNLPDAFTIVTERVPSDAPVAIGSDELIPSSASEPALRTPRNRLASRPPGARRDETPLVNVLARGTSKEAAPVSPASDGATEGPTDRTRTLDEAAPSSRSRVRLAWLAAGVGAVFIGIVALLISESAIGDESRAEDALPLQAGDIGPSDLEPSDLEPSDLEPSDLERSNLDQSDLEYGERMPSEAADAPPHGAAPSATGPSPASAVDHADDSPNAGPARTRRERASRPRMRTGSRGRPTPESRAMTSDPPQAFRDPGF
jgi:serine/threonine-protein kinase